MPNGLLYLPYANGGPIFPVWESPWPTVLNCCGHDSNYENGLIKLWSAYADIVVIEHDMVATNKHVQELLCCPYILCAFAYKVHPASTAEQESRWAHAHRIPYDPIEGMYRYIEDGEEWSDHAGFGFTKLGRLARQEVDHWEEGSWQDLDTRLSWEFHQAGIKYHIHWPEMEHNHK